MPIRTRHLPVLFLCSLCTSAWSGQEAPSTSLENLLTVEVEGASRFAQPLSEAPSSVSVVSAEDIRQYGFRTLGEALQSARGVYTTNERDYTYIGIRGFARPGDYNTRVLLQTDGIRRNDPLYDSAALGNEAPIEVDWVKRLEFVPGPSSALYGPNALFGVANAVLWSGSDINGTRIRADVGTGNMTRMSVLSGQGGGDGEWLVGISAYGRRGEDLYFREFDNPATNNGMAQGRDGERYFKAMAKLSTGNWQFDAGYSFRRKNIPTAYYDTLFNTGGNYITDQYAYADLSHSQVLSNDWSANLRLRAGNYQYTGQYPYSDRTNRDEAEASWVGLDYLLTYTGLKNHKVLLGAEWQNNYRLDQRNFDVSTPTTYLDDRRSASNTGLFIQDEWRFDPKWMANLGLRLDHVSGYGTASPRIAVIHQLLPAATLKFIYGQAFRPPNAYERYYNDGNLSQKVNPDLRLERITTHEIAADFAVTPALRLSTSYYHYRIDNLIDQITDPSDGLLTFINRPPVYAHGLELESEAMLPRDFHIKASVAWQEVEQSFGTPPNSPKLLGKLLMDGPLCATGWTVGLNLQALGKRNSITREVPGYGAGSLVLRKKGGPGRGEWTLGIYNLSGQRYLDPASAAVSSGVIAQDGRQFRLSWEVGF